jgi:competence protein ComEC
MDGNLDQFGVLDQLIYGQTSASSAEPIARILGLVHLYRASGVHLLAFFTCLDFALEWILKSLGCSPKRGRFIGLGITGISIFWIWKLQNFRLTLIRPIFTFIIRQFFQNRGARAKIILPLVLTFIFECILSPTTSLSSGAFHYYLSVMGGLLGFALVPNTRPFLRHLSLAVGSWLPLAVFSLAHDHLVSYLTPVYSLISIPIITVFLYPLTLIDILVHGQISPLTVNLWNGFLKLLFALPDFGPTFAVVSVLSVWSALPIALAFAFFWEKIPKRFWVFSLGCLGLASIGHAELLRANPGHEIAQIDVHQGDGAAMKIPTRTEMVDVGSLKTYAPDQWLQKLARLQITHIDAVLLTHLDEDHVGALKELLYLAPVACVETNAEHWSSDRGIKWSTWIHENTPGVMLASSGCIRLSQVAWFKSSRGSGNDLMAGIVFPLSPGHAYFALGDGDEVQELAYEHYFQNEIESSPYRIWKISHHGSRFSSNFGFLKRLDAEEFWISVGKHNPYHHPNPLTLLKLSTLSGRIYRTDVDGDIVRSFKE